MLTAAAVATMLGISPRAVYDIPHDRLPRYMLGAGRGAVRFDPADVAAYKRATQAKPGPSARALREYMRLRRRAEHAGVAEGLPELSARQREIAELRVRNMRSPPWASGEAIAAIYREARRISEETGVPHHVDHEIPLVGQLVSGLHVETNLRIVSAVENIKKSNRFEPC